MTIQKLLKTAGFKDISVFPRRSDICVAAYKVLTVGCRLFFSKSWWKMLASVICIPIWALSLLIGQICLHGAVGSQDDCLGYMVWCKKMISPEGHAVGKGKL